MKTARVHPSDFLHPWLDEIAPYEPGLQQENLIKLNTNENLYSFPTKILEQELSRNSSSLSKNIHLYPEPSSLSLRQAIADQFHVAPECVLIGNGSDNILSMIFHCLLPNHVADQDPNQLAKQLSKQLSKQLAKQLANHGSGHALIAASTPTYGYYACLAQAHQLSYAELPLKENWRNDFCALEKLAASLTIFALPNSPTGLTEEKDELSAFISNTSGLVLIDAAYDAFAAKQSLLPEILQPEFRNLLVCGTFSKAYSLAGLRVGWLVADAAIIRRLNKIREPYNVNMVGQRLALAALRNQAIFTQRIQTIIAIREWFQEELQRLNFEVIPSQANFIFARLPKSMCQTKENKKENKKENESSCAKDYFEYLKGQKILIRFFDTPRTRDYVRISIGSRENMEILLKCTKHYLQERNLQERNR